MTEIEQDEQFYRDTESVAFPKLDDRQPKRGLFGLPVGLKKLEGRFPVLVERGTDCISERAVSSNASVCPVRP